MSYREPIFMFTHMWMYKSWDKKKSSNPTFTQRAEYFTRSLMCYSAVPGGSSLSHNHALRYLLRQFYRSAALLVWIEYSAGIQVINFQLTPVMLLVPCCSADN